MHIAEASNKEMDQSLQRFCRTLATDGMKSSDAEINHGLLQSLLQVFIKFRHHTCILSANRMPDFIEERVLTCNSSVEQLELLLQGVLQGVLQVAAVGLWLRNYSGGRRATWCLRNCKCR